MKEVTFANADRLLLPMPPETSIARAAEEYTKRLGIRYLYCRIELVDELINDEVRSCRRSIELLNEASYGEFEETSEFRTSKRTPVFRLKRIQRRCAPMGHMFEHLAKEFGEHFSSVFDDRLVWHHSDVLWNRDSLGYAINSNREWPAWTFVGTVAPLPDLDSDAKEWRQGDEKQEIAEHVLGINRQYKPGLFPCSVFRLQQDLVRIADNRISSTQGDETVWIRFQVSNSGWSLLQRNDLVVSYALVDGAGKVIGSGTLDHDPREHPEGIHLPLDPEYRGAGVQVGEAKIDVRLGDVLVDWSRGGYIRSVNVVPQFT